MWFATPSKADAATHPSAAYAIVNTSQMLLKQIADQKTPFNAYIERITPQANGIATLRRLAGASASASPKRLSCESPIRPEEFPESLTYILYGQGREVALAHRATKADDFDQVLELDHASHAWRCAGASAGSSS